jgi:hypothetical protein
MFQCLFGLVLVSAQSAPPKMAFERLIHKIQDADYRGDRSALESLAKESESLLTAPLPQHWVRYWRGFALWREAVNGFNDGMPVEALETALTRANAEFEQAVRASPSCVEAKLGKAGCLMNLMYLHRSDPDALKAVPTIAKLFAEVEKNSASNPRLCWVKGPAIWNSPIERGGGEAAAITLYMKGLALCAKQPLPGPFEPGWGEPELYMSLAWSHLNRQKPNLAEAESCAREALRRVPNWHYVKDILLPRILHGNCPKQLSIYGQKDVFPSRP